ncbi:MAG: hypothetical protein BWY74_01419 [Firmicutes bacterium ADurb.Bin419]|jgi:hypothetical protein|nr:MAG: hypothetical protein BWY74_01419 [Firmicutes bacterium ADurb.Bin419]
MVFKAKRNPMVNGNYRQEIVSAHSNKTKNILKYALDGLIHSISQERFYKI